MITLSEGGLNDADDNNAGVDAQQIVYPGVYTCITVTGVLADGRLVGAHLARMWSADKLARGMARMRVLAGGSEFLSIYIVGMLTKSWSPAMFARQYDYGTGQLAQLVRAGLGNVTCNGWAYDTSAHDTVEVSASKVGTGTAGAFIDITPSGLGSQFIRPHEFARI